MELANYLKFLLYNHDSVVIPGMGTLLTLYKHAEVNSSDKTISPPSKYLNFDSTRTKTDNLLQNYLSEIKKIDKIQANIELKQLLIEFNDKLDSGETVLLDGIGYFSKDNNIIRFEKEQDANFLTDSFGLTQIDYEPIDTEAFSFNTPLTNNKPRKSYSSLILLVVLIILIGGGLFIYLNYPDLINLRTKRILQPAFQPTTDTLKKDVSTIDTLAPKTDIEKFFESTTDKKNALALPSKNTVDTAENRRYFIIAGSFKTINKAKILAKEIEKDGYKTQIIKADKTIYRISLGEYTNLDTAITELEKIRSSKGDNTVWLLKEKK